MQPLISTGLNDFLLKDDKTVSDIEIKTVEGDKDSDEKASKALLAGETEQC